jgi:hypothetical protein
MYDHGKLLRRVQKEVDRRKDLRGVRKQTCQENKHVKKTLTNTHICSCFLADKDRKHPKKALTITYIIIYIKIKKK